MQITWLGHGSFRIEVENAVLLIDPWFTGSPVFPAEARERAIAGATHVLLTHGHGDHTADAAGIAKELNIPVVGIPELIGWLKAKEGLNEGIDFNKGGTVDLNGAKVTMVTATHSSSITTEDGPVYMGTEAGYIIAGDGHTIYFSGDTDVMADMEIFGALHAPDIGILACGGHYTMDQKRAAWAAKRYFKFDKVIPCHYRTFPLLAQDAEVLKAELPGIEVIEPEVMTAIKI